MQTLTQFLSALVHTASALWRIKAVALFSLSALAFMFVPLVKADPIKFAEFNSFGGNSSSVSGNLDGVSFNWNVVNSGSTDLRFVGAPSNFNNTSSLFSSANFSPARNNVDALSYLYTFPNGSGTFALTFSQAVVNPTLHFFNLDVLRWDFSGTTSATLSQTAGNSEFSLNNGSVRDQFPATFSGPLSAYGSVLFTGVLSSITGTFSLNPGSAGGSDSGFLQISIDSTQQVSSVSEPSSTLILVLALALALATSKLQRRYRLMQE